MGLVLASGSPRRSELLRMIGIMDFAVMPAEVDEEIHGELPPEQAVCEIALKKAKNVSRLCDIHDTIISADTLVYLGGRSFGKPDGPGGAATMLRELSGKRHTVYTGVVLLRGSEFVAEAEATDVYFREISDSEISDYVSTGDPLDKAGAYGAQGRAAVFIERIDGDFYNVMGLPLCRLLNMLKAFGVA